MQEELDFGYEATQTERRNEKLMQALDAVNERYERGTLKLGSALVECREGPPKGGE